MSTVAVVIEGDTLRCFAAICIGLLIGCVGLDSFTAQERLNFGAWQLSGGFQSTAIMMGLFATCEIMQQLKSLIDRYGGRNPKSIADSTVKE
jgi:putative tricarboxylic transport membrane protein